MTPETGDLPRVPPVLRAAAWALVAVAVLLPVVLLGVHQRVLAGALDVRYFASYEYDAQGNETRTVSPDVDFWDRWSVLSGAAPADRALLAAAAACVVLAGLHLTTGVRWPLPRACRWAGAGAAALSALSAAAVVVVDLVAVQLPEGEGAYFPSSSSFLDVAPVLAAMATALVFSAVAGVVLLGPALPPAAAAAEDPGPAAEPLAEPAAEPLSEPDVEPAAEPPAAQPFPGPAAGSPAGTPAGAGEVPPFPRPSAEDYAHYRRPQP